MTPTTRTVPKIRSLPARERGAALLVAMVMVFLLSVLGVSSMRGASLEGRLASNALHKELTFQAAESSTDQVLARSGVFEAQICRDGWRDLAMPALSTEGRDTAARLAYGGRAHVRGFSIGGPIAARRFVVEGRSELTGASTATVISQGVVMIGAADDSGDC